MIDVEAIRRIAAQYMPAKAADKLLPEPPEPEPEPLVGARHPASAFDFGPSKFTKKSGIPPGVLRQIAKRKKMPVSHVKGIEKYLNAQQGQNT